jgi:hypothetical protein
MGFFDKAKRFFGGHGVKVQHLIIERQDPNAATLPIGDTVVKGKFKVTAEKPATVLSMKAEFCMEMKHPDGREELVVLGSDVFPEPHTSRSDDMQQYPFDLAPGGEAEDFFIIAMESDISTELGKRNVSAGQVRFFVKTSVDVQGALLDPEASTDIRVLA